MRYLLAAVVRYWLATVVRYRLATVARYLRGKLVNGHLPYFLFRQVALLDPARDMTSLELLQNKTHSSLKSTPSSSSERAMQKTFSLSVVRYSTFKSLYVSSK